MNQPLVAAILFGASLKGKQAPAIDGFTCDQRFFIAFAQGGATKMREQALRARIATDGHAPGMYRATSSIWRPSSACGRGSGLFQQGDVTGLGVLHLAGDGHGRGI